jgi:hypothetical protein
MGQFTKNMPPNPVFCIKARARILVILQGRANDAKMVGTFALLQFSRKMAMTATPDPLAPNTASPLARLRRYRMLPALALLCPLFCAMVCALPQLAMAAEANPLVKARRSNGKLLLDITMTVPVRAPLAFEVMTDYNHMPAFIPGILASKSTRSTGNKLLVTQNGKASSGILSFSWESVREVSLTPPLEISSKVTGGTVKNGESVTRFVQEENQTRIIVHSESTASLLLPPLIGTAFVESQVRRQYSEFRDEMIKRQKALERSSSAASAGLPPPAPSSAASAASGSAPGTVTSANPAASATAGAAASLPAAHSSPPIKH